MQWSDFDAKHQLTEIGIESFLKCNVGDCDPHKGIQNGSSGGIPFRQSRRIIFINNCLEIVDHQEFDARISINGFWIKWLSTRVWLSVEILIDERKPVVFWEISVWITRYIKNNGIFQNFRILGIETQNTKPPIFQSSNLLQVERFWLRPKWKNWALFLGGEWAAT